MLLVDVHRFAQVILEIVQLSWRVARSGFVRFTRFGFENPPDPMAEISFHIIQAPSGTLPRPKAAKKKRANSTGRGL